MVFQATSPVKSFAVVQRAATVSKKPKIEPEPKVESPVMASTIGSSHGDMTESLPSDVSQADTQRTSQLSTFSNTDGRDRSSWKRMSSLFKRSSEALRPENKLTKPNPNAPAPQDGADSPTDPMYNPETKSFRVELPAKDRKIFEKRMSKETTKSPIDAAVKSFKSAPKIEMPMMAITGPDEPRSFLDLDSSSDEETPIIQRASSVKVSKPRIVRHNSGSAGRVPRISEAGPPMDKSGQLLGDDLKSVQGLTSHQDAEGGPSDALRMLEGTDSVDGSMVALPPTPPSRTETPKDSIKETVVVVPGQAPGVASEEAKAVTAKDSPRNSLFDGLRSNPLSATERVHLSRTMSAPLPPNRNPNRRVTIRPSDLVINHTDADHRIFREGVVTTPYPNRLSMVNELTENRLSTAFTKETLSTLPDLRNVPAVKPHPQPTSITPTPIEKTGDRFPSPDKHTEHLFLTLSLPAPPNTPTHNFTTSASTTITIPIPDRATFDDAALFTLLRASYLSQLLGARRRFFSSRTLSHVTLADTHMHIDSAAFIAHLQRPSLGNKKKGWTIWLRALQAVKIRESSLFSGHGEDNWAPGHSHTPSNVSAYWSPTSQGHSTTVPRMPFSRIQGRDLPPRVILHYRFSVLAITLAMLLVAVLAVLSTVLWVLFGVPGLGAGEREKETIFGEVGWRREAQFRVLTGLVMGLVVGCLGVGGVGAWVAGGWVLL